jgi:hypothetical protein
MISPMRGAPVDPSATVDDSEHELARARERLGDHHPDTLAARSVLATLYRRARRFDEASAQLEGLLAGLRATRGAEDQQTLEAQQRLAFAYRLADRLGDAERAYEAVIAGRSKTLGAQHPDTLIAEEHLAAVRRRRWHETVG